MLRPTTDCFRSPTTSFARGVVWKVSTGLNDLAEADSDHDSNGADFLLWQNHLGRKAAFAAITEAVPEPGAAGLIGAALATLWTSRRRRACGEVGQKMQKICSLAESNRSLHVNWEHACEI